MPCCLRERAGLEAALVTPEQAYAPEERDPPGPLIKEPVMSDKSPRHSLSKKSGKSIKEKRADKKAKADGSSTSGIETTLHGKKR